MRKLSAILGFSVLLGGFSVAATTASALGPSSSDAASEAAATLAAPAGSVPAASVLSLNQWRNQQITEAQNRAIRIANRLTVIKAQSPVRGPDYLRLEGEYRAALQNLEIVKSLGIDEYLEVYLGGMAADDQAMLQAAKTLSSEDVARLLRKAIVDRQRPSTRAAN